MYHKLELLPRQKMAPSRVVFRVVALRSEEENRINFFCLRKNYYLKKKVYHIYWRRPNREYSRHCARLPAMIRGPCARSCIGIESRMIDLASSSFGSNGSSITFYPTHMTSHGRDCRERCTSWVCQWHPILDCIQFVLPQKMLKWYNNANWIFILVKAEQLNIYTYLRSGRIRVQRICDD